VDNRLGQVGSGPKYPFGPNQLGLYIVAHFDPKLSPGLGGFGLFGFAGSQIGFHG
jgi:hypothetical protein